MGLDSPTSFSMSCVRCSVTTLPSALFLVRLTTQRGRLIDLQVCWTPVQNCNVICALMLDFVELLGISTACLRLQVPCILLVSLFTLR